MRCAHNSHWWAPDAWTPPRLRVCGGIQVFGYRDLAPEKSVAMARVAAATIPC